MNFCNIIQTKHFAVRQRLDDDILKFFRLLQTSFVADCILEGLVAAFTELSRSSFYVLFSQGCRYVARYQFVLCHNVWLQPDTHRIVLAHHIGITHTLYTLNLRNQVDLCIVFDECVCIGVGFVVKREYDQHGSLALLSRYTDFGYFGRQQSLCHGNTVLYVDGSHVRVSSLLEVDGDITGTCIGCS